MLHPQKSNHRAKIAPRNRARRGQALVEMAFVVTILLFLTMGLIQFAIIANARITMTNLAREGARFAAVHGTEARSDDVNTTYAITDSRIGIKPYVTKVADATPLNTLAVADVTVSPATYNLRVSGQPVTVTVTYNLRNKFILPVSFPGLSRFGTAATASSIFILE